VPLVARYGQPKPLAMADGSRMTTAVISSRTAVASTGGGSPSPEGIGLPLLSRNCASVQRLIRAVPSAAGSRGFASKM
jgi:hypothetical protein